MERRRRERSRSPIDVKENNEEKYTKERDKDRNRRKDAVHKNESYKSSMHNRGEHERRSDPRENHKGDQKHVKYNNPRREEYDGRGSRHRPNVDRHDERRNEDRQNSDRTLRPGRDTSQERIIQSTDGQREEHRRDGRHNFRGNRDQNEKQRDERRPAYQARQRGRRRESDNEPEDSSRYGRPAGEEGTAEEAVEAEKPNFGLSGKLTEYTNTYKGVVIKYNEPLESRKPKTRWRLYPFKGEEGLPVLYIHRQSAYLLGRQRHIADIPVDHPSCSKQHAVLQYRLANYERPDGTAGRKIKPYIIDLESANGTFLNNQKIEPRRYYELKERDVIKFGFSSREYVILHEKSSNAQEGGTGEPAGSGNGSGSGSASGSESESDASADSET